MFISKQNSSSLPGSPGKMIKTRQLNWSHTGRPQTNHPASNQYSYHQKQPYGYSPPQLSNQPLYPYALQQAILMSNQNDQLYQQQQQQQQLNGKRMVVLPCLENIDLPFADDSKLNTPSADHLSNFQNTHNFVAFKQRFTALPSRFTFQNLKSA